MPLYEYRCQDCGETIETIQNGSPTTSFMQFGDRIRIEMCDADSRSIFGAIDQTVVHYTG